MKITIIAVSVSALSQIQIFQKEYAKKYPEDAIDFAVFYVAGMENKYLMHPEILEKLQRRREKLEQRLEKQNPEGARRLHQWEQELRQKREESS